MAMPGIVIQIGADTASAIAGINKVEKALGRSLTPVEKLGRAYDKVLVPALATAGIAAAAFAVKIGVDGVNAALADEKALNSLNKTLENVGQGWTTDSVDAWIDSTARATGIADDALRPAMQSLVTVTKDAGAAQDLLAVAMDAAAGSTQSLESVTSALAKAAGGNTTALGKMFPTLDKSRLSTEGLSYATAELTSAYAGQASVAANTYQGKIDRLSVAAGEATEVIGYALLGALDDVSNSMGGTGGAADAADTLATEFSYLITGTGKVASGLAKVAKAALSAVDATSDEASATDDLFKVFSVLGGPLWSSISGLRNFGRAAQTTAAQTDMATGAVNRLAAGYAALAAARVPAQQSTERAVAATWNSGYVTQMNQANEAAKRAAAAQTALEKATTGGGGGGGGGGSAGATKKLTEETNKAKAAFDRMAASVRDTYTALQGAQSEIDAAWTAMREGGERYAQWLTSGISLSAAMQEATASIGTEAAISYIDAFTAQIKDSTAAAEAMKALSDQLKGLDIPGGGAEALMAQLMTLPPGVAATVANDLVANGMGPELARQLGEYNLFAGQAGVTWSNQFTDAGVNAAYAQYEAIAATLTSKLDALYELGKSMGNAVAQGYKDATAGIPQAGGRGAAGVSTRDAAPSVNVTVNGAIDPVGTARQIRRILATGDLRSGGGV